jgi:hypothetical protein
MRNAWSPQADWLCIDAGPRGNLVSSHDHASICHLLLYSQGRPILIDNGSGPYGDSPARLWRVGSAAHNVVTVDGQHQVPFTEEFRWQMPVCPTIDAWYATPEYAYFSGVHEGYARLPHPLPGSRRKVLYVRGDYWIVLDRFTTSYRCADAPHTYEQHFHLGVPAELREDGRVMTTGAGGNLLIMPVPGACGEATLTPNPYPLDGYSNPSHLCYTTSAAGNVLLATVLAPFPDERIPTMEIEWVPVRADGRELSRWEATGLAITLNGRCALYVDLHMEWTLPWQAGEHQGTTRMFFMREK